MKIVLINPVKSDLFALIFQHIKTFTEYINISFQKKGLYIQSMDSSHISIFEVNLPFSWFDEYILQEDGEEHKNDVDYDEDTPPSVLIGISSSILFKILNSREKTQKITINYNKVYNEDKLNIHFTGGENKEEFDKHFEVSLMNIDGEWMEIPETEYQAELTLSSYNFANIINQLKIFGTNLEINCSENKIILCASSPESGKMFVEIDIEDLTAFSINEGETVKLSFSLQYLHNICLYNKLSKEIELKFSDNIPIKITYNIFGDENAKMTFYLAPKISEDE
jgi:proliferating cell nuclear antigen